MPYFESGSSLKCYKNNDASPAFAVGHNGVGDYTNSANCALSVDDTRKKAALLPDVAVVPNPANNSGYIQFPAVIQNGVVAIYNSMGQLLVNETVHHASRWELQYKIPSPGIYFYSVRNGDDVFKGKFIYE